MTDPLKMFLCALGGAALGSWLGEGTGIVKGGNGGIAGEPLFALFGGVFGATACAALSEEKPRNSLETLKSLSPVPVPSTDWFSGIELAPSAKPDWVIEAEVLAVSMADWFQSIGHSFWVAWGEAQKVCESWLYHYRYVQPNDYQVMVYERAVLVCRGEA
jgi:hypothetical protein